MKYYLYILGKNQIPDASAIIEYPKMKQTQIVEWEDGDQEKILEWIEKISGIIHSESCPPLLKKSICKKCSYHDFCYSGEEK
ncbi:MAG: Dna2/Cas4 domain-containing protein [Anditalea sp.]